MQGERCFFRARLRLRLVAGELRLVPNVIVQERRCIAEFNGCRRPVNRRVPASTLILFSVKLVLVEVVDVGG